MEAPYPEPVRLRAPGRFACALALTCITGAVGQVELKSHSFGSPPNINLLAADWFLAGTAIPSTKSLVLSPGVPQRVGLIWHKYPVLTNDFETEFTFEAKGPDPATVSDNGFAFWYVNENASASQRNVTESHMHNQEHVTANLWMSAMRSQGFHLLGYRSQFDGLGVFFCDSKASDPGEQEHKVDPAVTVLVNDGIKPYKLWRGVPADDAKKVDFRSGKEVKVNVRVKSDGVKVTIDGGNEIEVKKPMKAGGYLGFSIYSGMKGSPSPQEKSDYVVVKSLKVINHDQGAKGEDVPIAAVTEKPKAGEEKEDIIHESSTFRDHRGESDAIKALTNMVFKLVVESQPLRTQMTRAIDSLSKRLTVMEQSFKSLKEELDKKTGHKLDAEFDAMKKELVTLSQYATTETKERSRKLETLHADISSVHKAGSATSADHIDKHLSKLEESNQRTIENLTSEHRKMFGVSMFAIAFIVIAGLSLYNKFRCWEKKHIL